METAGLTAKDIGRHVLGVRFGQIVREPVPIVFQRITVQWPVSLITARMQRAVAAPAGAFKDLNGKTVKSSDRKGKVVILDFWATWCGPCRIEIPACVDLQKNHGAKRLVVVGIALDEEGTAVVKPFAAKAGINYTVLMGDAKVQRAFGDVEALPTTFVLDREGRIVNKHVGYADKTTFENKIKRLLSP